MAIELKEALNLLESGDWCRLRYITADLKKGTGGKVIELLKCRIARRRPVSAQPTTGAGKSSVSHTKRRQANHHANATRNVEVQNGSILTVHVPLITHINGNSVLLTSQQQEGAAA